MKNPLPERFPVRVLRRRWHKEWRRTDESDGRGYVEVGEEGVRAGGVFTMDADRSVRLYKVPYVTGLLATLPDASCKLWLWAVLRLGPGQDTVRISHREGMALLGCKSSRTVSRALEPLLEAGLLAPAGKRSHFFINPYFAFHGDRLHYLRGFERSTVVVFDQPDDEQ